MSFCIRHNNCATKTHFMLSLQGNAIGWWIWVNYNNSHTWKKAVVGYFPIRTMIQVTSQWGRYNVPKWMMFADVDDVDDDHDDHDDNDHEIWNMKYDEIWSVSRFKHACRICTFEAGLLLHHAVPNWLCLRAPAVLQVVTTWALNLMWNMWQCAFFWFPQWWIYQCRPVGKHSRSSMGIPGS